MKTISVLFLIGMSGLLLGAIQPVSAVDIKSTGDTSNTRSYQKIASLISTIEEDVKRDMLTINKKLTDNDQTTNSYKSTLASYTSSLKSFKQQFDSAQSAFDKYDKAYNGSILEDAELLKSLTRQRVFINEERKYIDSMEQESLNLKKYSPQYVIIQQEIREMRVQVNKEIQDVENAYNKAKSNVLAQRLQSEKQRTTEQSKKTEYMNMVTKYESLTNTYSTLLEKIGSEKTGNLQIKKELQDQLDLLQEIRVILATFKPGQDTDNKYQQQYEKCVEDFRLYRNKYQNMNCTAI